MNLASDYYAEGQRDKAVPLLKKALKLKTNRPEKPTVQKMMKEGESSSWIFALLPALPALLLSGSLSCGQIQESRMPSLASRLGCFACHSLNRTGGNLAVALDGIGARLSRQQLQVALAYPRQLHSKAKMPCYAYLPRQEQEALVQYLESLK